MSRVVSQSLPAPFFRGSTLRFLCPCRLQNKNAPAPTARSARSKLVFDISNVRPQHPPSAHTSAVSASSRSVETATEMGRISTLIFEPRTSSDAAAFRLSPSLGEDPRALGICQESGKAPGLPSRPPSVPGQIRPRLHAAPCSLEACGLRSHLDHASQGPAPRLACRFKHPSYSR